MSLFADWKPFVARPDVGTAGQKCRLLANHYRLDNIPDVVIYQYAIDLAIDGFPLDRKIPAKIARDIFSSTQVQRMLGAAKDTFVFDGTSSSPSD